MKQLLRRPTAHCVLFSSLLVVAACSSDRPMAPSNRPRFDISDAVHHGGTAGFFFLPPIVAQPAVTEALDVDIAALNPQVAICDVSNGPDVDCGGSSPGATAAIVVYTPTSTPAVGIDLTNASYHVNWDTKLAGFVPGNTYRVHVTAGVSGVRRELGFADVLLTTTPGQVKDLATGDIVVLNDGRTLPVRFLIASGIPGSLVASAATASITTGSTDLITATLQDLHGVPFGGAAIAWTLGGVAGTLDPTSGQTDAVGTTVTTFTAGTTPGTAAVTAASMGLSATASVSVMPRVVAKPLYVANGRGNSVLVFAPGSMGDATPMAVLAGSNTRLDFPVAVTLDARGSIYVANFDGDVSFITVYAPGATDDAAPTAVIAGGNTGLCDPYGLAVDAAGSLYVANHCANSIAIFAPGANGDVAPRDIIVGSNTGLSSPSGVVLDASGRIYVANQGDFAGSGQRIEVFASGASGNATPLRSIAGDNTGLVSPAGIALDAAGNVYVPNANSFPANITIYGPTADGDVPPANTIITGFVGNVPDLAFVFPFPIGIAVDDAGNVHVASFGNQSVVVYAAGASGVSTPLAVIAGSNTGLDGLGGASF